MIDLYLHMGVALILVSGLILLLGVFLKKRQNKESLMHVMGYQSLGPKKGIAMVKVGREVLLVGVTATDVKLLKSLDARMDDPATEQCAERRDSWDEPAPQTAGVITADAPGRLGKLKALKNSLKDTVYAVK